MRYQSELVFLLNTEECINPLTYLERVQDGKHTTIGRGGSSRKSFYTSKVFVGVFVEKKNFSSTE